MGSLTPNPLPLGFRGNKFIYQKVEYVHNNPVVESVVELVEEYIYSSAPVYAGKDGTLDVVCIPQRLKKIY